MNLPLINVFETPYEIWKNDGTSFDDVLVRLGRKPPIKKQLIKRICNHFDAAAHILERGMDNGLEFHIDRQLQSSNECTVWKSRMPIETPKPLFDYKNSYPKYDIVKVDEAINTLGVNLSDGQTLFHGGLFDDFGNYPTSKPLSASFCPQVALRNAEWRGKAYDRGQIDIFVLKVKSPISKVFFYNLDDELGNEKEVLFASGATLRLIRRTKILDQYNVCKIDSNLRSMNKDVPVYIVEIDIS